MTEISEQDTFFMKRAIKLARLGLANTSPNPRVGAVVVHNGKIIGEGFHRKAGQGHAEVNAISSVKPGDMALLHQATIYVTLEPCSHYGKTPPCAKLLIDKGIKRVVVGNQDPSPKVNGKGIKMLEDAGIEVTILTGKISQECKDLNPEFNSKYLNSRPFITLKWAETADGFMANNDGTPLAISSSITSTLTHRLRARNDVILTSSATVIADNPRLDTRYWATGNAPLRAVIDRYGRVNPDSRIFQDDERNTLYFTLKERNDLKNAEQIIIPAEESKQLQFIIDDIASRGFNSVLVEAGPRLLQSFIDGELYDKIRIEKSAQVIGTSPVTAPILPQSVKMSSSTTIGKNTITTYK